MKRLLCFIFGHKFIFIDGHDNGRSKFKDFMCQRCGDLHQSQYDYVV